MREPNEPFARVKIDQLLKDVGWKLADGNSVAFEYVLEDGGRADYVLFDRNGRALAVLEAKRSSISPAQGEAQGRRYAQQLDVPFIFLSNGEEVRFWDWRREAHPRKVETLFSQADLERRAASRKARRDPLSLAQDPRIAGRPYQQLCIDTICEELNAGRRKMLIEMATGTGKTRTAAGLMSRLFEANVVTRALFVVDRNTLAIQAEDAFAEHLPSLPCFRVPKTGRRFQDEKRITIVTLQTLVNEYHKYSSGYFDLIIVDECHRSIYGKWRKALDHFDGVKIGLTATPCVYRGEDTDDLDDKAVRDTMRFFEVREPTFRYTLKEAIEQEYLVPYEIYRALTVKTASRDGFEVMRDEIDWEALSEKDRKELEEVFGYEQSIMVDPAALERKFTIPERNRAMVREFRDVLDRGYERTDGSRRAPDWGKTIVFAVNKRHAETLANLFDYEFGDKKPDLSVRYADFVVSGQGKDDTVDGAAKIKRFKKEQFPKILVSVNMLDTGFDCPEVVNLVLARFTRSSILYQQMRGRGTRMAPGKTRFTMFDFTGVTQHHGDEEGEHEGGVVVVRAPTGVSEPGGARRLLTLDIHDEIDEATREWVTVDEHGQAAYDETEARAEELGVAFEAWFESRPFNSDQTRLLHLVKEQLMANAATMEYFDSFRFDLAPFSLRGGFARARQVFGGEAQLEAVISDMNRAVFGDESDRGGSAGEDRPDLYH